MRSNRAPLYVFSMRWNVGDGVVQAALLGTAVLGLSEAQTLAGSHKGPTWVGVAAGIVFALSVFIWRERPWLAFSAVFATIAATYLLGLSQQGYVGEILAGIIVVYRLANQRPLRQALCGLAIGLVIATLTAIQTGFFNYAFAWVFLGSAFLVGRAFRIRRDLVDQLRAALQELDERRHEDARLAVADERVRIARELHDVVAHAVSVIVVQAGAAKEMLAVDPTRASEPLVFIQQSGRQALTELRRLLAVLRPENLPTPSLAPQPGLADLAELAQTLRQAGLPVRVVEEGRPCSLPPGMDLAAYRIVQEALTNALKHAKAQTVSVAVRYHPDAIELEVVDDGLGSANQQWSSGEHGLIGMRERAAAYGGEFCAGPRPTGGYGVRARLPLMVKQ